MLEVLIQLLFVFIVSLGAGLGFSALLKVSFYNPVSYIFFGLFWVAIIGRCLNFFVPMNEKVFFLFFTIAVLYSIFNYKKHSSVFVSLQDIFIHNKVVIAIVLAFVIWFSALPSISYDEGLYHAGFIAWLNKYSIVRGLANVEIRYALNSNWHFLQSIFNGYHIWDSISNSLNSFLVISFTLYFLEIFKHSKNNFFLLLLFVPIILIYHLIDPSTDLVVILFTMAFVSELVLNREGKKIDLFWFFAIPFLITVKANAILLLPLLLVYVVFASRKRDSLFKNDLKIVFIYLVLLVATWILSNLMISGYLFFPYLDLPHWNPIWKLSHLDKGIFEKSVNYSMLQRWAGVSIDQINGISKIQAFDLWWAHVRLLDKSLFVFSVSSSLAFIYVSRKSASSILISVLLFVILGLNFILSFDFRFYGGITLSVLLCLLMSSNWSKVDFKKYNITAVFLILEFGATFFIYNNLYYKTFQSTPSKLISLVSKSSYKYSEMKKVVINGVEYTIPIGNEFSWDSIPSMAHENLNVFPIGKNIQDGFYKK